MPSPYQWITGSQQRTPLPALHTTCSSTTQPSRLFWPSTSLFYSNPPTELIQLISVDPTLEQLPLPEVPIPPKYQSSYAQASFKEQQALVTAYLQEHSPVQPDNNDDTMPELKAGLPGNFSRKEEDANLWLFMIKAYFTMNPFLYKEKHKILAFLNKMDVGWGWSFTEGWLMRCANETIKDKDQTFTKIKADFIEKFPFDQAFKAWHTLVHMWMEDEPFKGDFHKFKSEFEFEVARSGVTDKHILKDMLERAVSANLAFKMTALLEEPDSQRVASQSWSILWCNHLYMQTMRRNQLPLSLGIQGTISGSKCYGHQPDLLNSGTEGRTHLKQQMFHLPQDQVFYQKPPWKLRMNSNLFLPFPQSTTP